MYPTNKSKLTIQTHKHIQKKKFIEIKLHNEMYQYIFFRLQYNGTMPSINTIEMFPVVIASAWHELIPPLLCSITFIIIFWVSS